MAKFKMVDDEPQCFNPRPARESGAMVAPRRRPRGGDVSIRAPLVRAGRSIQRAREIKKCLFQSAPRS